MGDVRPENDLTLGACGIAFYTDILNLMMSTTFLRCTDEVFLCKKQSNLEGGALRLCKYPVSQQFYTW